MKKLRFLFLALLLSSPVLAEDTISGAVGPFSGLNNTDNSLTISANSAQDLLNVDLTPGGRSVKKRKGYAQAFALGVTTNPVHGVYSFFDASGNDVVLAFNDTRLTASVAGGTATLLASTFTVNGTWQCVDSQGSAYCASSNRQGILKTQGTTWSYLPVTSSGTMVAVTPERMVQAGFASTPNRLDFSKANDFTTWTVGGLPTDPITFTITTPGSRITHIVYAQKKIFWFKENSFGYILQGDALADWQIRTVSTIIGTLDNTSAQDTAGTLYFRGQDGHIYSTDGVSVMKASRDIEGTTSTAGTRRSNSLTLTSGTDWTGGTLTSGGGTTVYIDTVTSAGNLQTTFPDQFTSYRDGNNSTKQVWQTARLGISGVVIPSGSVSVSAGKLNIQHSSAATSSAYFGIGTVNPLPIIYTGTTAHFRLEGIPYSSADAGYRTFQLRFSTHPLTSTNSINEGKTAAIYFEATSGSTAAFVTQVENNNTTIPSSTSVSGTFPFDFDFWFSTGNYTITIDGVTKILGTWSAGSNPTKNAYAYLLYAGSSSVTSTMVGDNFNVLPETFTYTSASQSVSSAITAWDTFSVTKNDNAGSTAFAIRQSAVSTYTAVTVGGYPAFNPSTYWQVIATVTASNTSTNIEPVSISDITQNWFEGSANDKSYATFFKDKVLFSVASSSTSNNRTLVFDLINNAWTLYDLKANGFYIRNNALYFGSAIDGLVHKFGDTDNDNGSAINAYWKSKDFFMDNPFINKEVTSVSVAADSVASSSMTVTYTLDGAYANSYTMALGSAKTYARSNKNLPAGKVGGTLNLKFGNNVADQFFEVFALGYAYRPKPWTVEP